MQWGTNGEVASAFWRQDHEGPWRSKSVFWERGECVDVIYSYGRHFPMAVRLKATGGAVLVNGDRYSVTTSHHQSLLNRGSVGDSVTSSFTMLRAAGIDPLDGEVRVVDFTRDKTGHDAENIPAGATVRRRKNYQSGKLEVVFWHTAGHCLLEYKGRQYVGGMDDRSYWISELPRADIESVNGALAELKPTEVIGCDFVRQGEWFFVDLGADVATAKRAWRDFAKDFVLPREDDERSNAHTVTRGGFMSDVAWPEIAPTAARWVSAKTLVVSGRVRHPEHRQLTLCTGKAPQLFAAWRNRAVASWSSGPLGVNVD